MGYGVWAPPAPSSRGQGLFAGTREHAGVVGGLTGAHERHPYEGMLSGSGFTPHPNLPPSRGKGFADAERAVWFAENDGGAAILLT